MPLKLLFPLEPATEEPGERGVKLSEPAIKPEMKVMFTSGYDAKIADALSDNCTLRFLQKPYFLRHGVEIADQTMRGWMAQSAALMEPLYERLKKFVLASKVVGTDDTPVKVLDRKLPQARKGRIWPYTGDRDHPAVVYDYTPTRERAGPERFLKDYRGYLQADAYAAYDSFFTKPERGMTEVACWAHTRRHFHKAMDSNPSRMRTVLLLIAQLYRVEKTARKQGLAGENLRLLREHGASPVLNRLHVHRRPHSSSCSPSHGIIIKPLGSPLLTGSPPA